MAERLCISRAIERYCSDYCWQKGYSKCTVNNYLWARDSFVQAVGDKYLDELSVDDIRTWRRFMDSRGWAINSVNAYLYKFRRIINHYSTECSLSPKDIIIPKKESKQPQFLLFEEVQAMINADISLRDKAIIALLYSTGMRVGEVAAARKKDLIGTDMIAIRGKGSIERKGFIDDTARHYLFNYLLSRTDGSPCLFKSKKCGGLKKGGIEKIVRDAAKAAGIDRAVHPHMLRHSFATHLVQNGIGQFHLKDILGHADISTTQMYVHLGTKDLRESYAEFHKVPKLT